MTTIEMPFFDPILRGPLLACSLMGALGAVMGVLVVFRQQSLVGETLSHACYPGMVIGAILAQVFLGPESQTLTTCFIFFGAGISSLLAARLIHWLVSRRYASGDVALSCLLGATFATGLLLISAVQCIYPALWRSLQALLMGQAATMRERDVVVSLLLSAICLGLVICYRRTIKVTLFDPDFARLTRLTNNKLEWVFLGALVLTVIVSIRSMGVVLMSAMLIFPAVSARLLSNNFEKMLVTAALIGGGCGLGGVLLSHEYAAVGSSGELRSLWLPTGPLIALLLTVCFCVILFFSPSEGLLIRSWRRRIFVRRCQRENTLKTIWKECSHLNVWTVSPGQLAEMFQLSRRSIGLLLRPLQKKGYLCLHQDGSVEMTQKGMAMGKKLVRLHRLWELYLVEYCGMPKERVHPNAEEMEHILTPEVEKELSVVLQNPSLDPHKQPIPSAD
jgi:manganese/zinc/iron transport system permease protein